MHGPWAFSSMPVYEFSSTDRRALRQAAKELRAAEAVHPFPSKDHRSQPPRPERPPPQPQPHALTAHDIAYDLLGPAVDGPPSPESIRAFSKQMRRTSVFEKHQSHHTNSSGSSSLRSIPTPGDHRRPSWENGFEGLTLSRKSSGRSTTTSSMQPRERPDSVQIFGKTLFNRRGKSRSALSSSGSSIYAPDVPEPMPPPPTWPPAKESSGLNIFGRRRTTSKPEAAAAAEAVAAQRKYQISGPYNFQHMTHSNTDHAPVADLPRGRNPDDLHHYADYSSEALSIPEEDEFDEFMFRKESKARIHNIRPPSAMHNQTSPQRLTMQRARSEDQLRGGLPPPRPPRSPIQPEYAYSPPVPPPRGSSHMSTTYDGSDEFDNRPQTSGGFRHPRPFGFPAEATSPPATSYGFSPSLDADLSLDHRDSRVGSPPDDSNWPLPCPTSYEKALPGVPEEDENAILTRHNRASVTSISSLRASQSVPLMRQLSLSQSPKSQRPPSGASETLGRFDLLAAQRALRAALVERDESEVVCRDSWEDDIDYCYEHEAEADCDFAWERPSLDDISRNMGAESITPVEVDRQLNPSVEVSPAILSPGQFDDVPSLSPCSRVSTATLHEAITPTGLLAPRTSNFSLPRAESRQSRPYLHDRKASDASSFRESHGFTLSPSLLIPIDFQQQMLAHEAEERHNLSFTVPYEEPMLTMDKSTLLIYPRTSASTTGSGSNDTDRSSSSERHISTTSASTDFTRLTMSTSSLDIENFIPMPEIDDVPAPPPVEEERPPFHARAKSQGNFMPSLPESEEAAFDPSLLRRGDATHASDPNLLSLASKAPAKSQGPLLTRRRARTTSLSTPPPPGQYALFPSVQMSGNRI